MSNKFQLRPALAGVALLASLTLASCGGNKPADTANTDTTTTTTTSTNPAAISSAAPSAPAVPPSPVATTAKVTPPSTTTTTTKTTSPTTVATLSPEAQQLGVKPQNATTCPTTAPIKGKVSKKRGLIYHVPKSPDFNAVKPELCFADIATAEKAGFRAPK